MDISLKGKTALVAGSSQGIGRSTALVLAANGANVVLIARNESALEMVKQDLDTSLGQQHEIIVADFANPDTVREAIKTYISKGNKIHILVNNTGGPAPGPASDATTDAFLSAFNQHLICNHILMQAVVPGMKEDAYGRIINIISTSVKQPLHGLGVSNTIRAAVANWSKTLSLELAKDGITVNNVLPGATYTGRLQSIIENKATKAAQALDEVEQHMMNEIPAGRFAAPEEVAYAVAFLASPSAAYINGINLPVDGGRTASL